MARAVLEIARARPVRPTVRCDPPSHQHGWVVPEPGCRRSVRDLCLVPAEGPASDGGRPRQHPADFSQRAPATGVLYPGAGV
jgi:hypothetical protein